jgi:hypothetical protein
MFGSCNLFKVSHGLINWRISTVCKCRCRLVLWFGLPWSLQALCAQLLVPSINSRGGPGHAAREEIGREMAYKFCLWPNFHVITGFFYMTWGSGFGGLVVIMLASGTQVCGFKPGQSRRIFSGVKILSMPSFGREVKPFAPCRRFAAW